MSGLEFAPHEQGAATQTESVSAQPLRGRSGGKPFVMIDGFNLALEKGTGVATYARNLSFGLRDLGYEVGVLYGGPFSASDPPLLQEVLFYDHQAPSARQRASAVLAPNWNRAFQVPATGAVISQSFASRLPHYDTLWNARNLYLKAAAHFAWFGTINRVAIARRPDVCHWTYPLPLRMLGVPNVYTLHDLVPLRLPYTTLDKKARYLKLLQWICKNAAHIVTVSESSRRDIIELLGVDPDKVTNTYQAISIPDEHRRKSEDVLRREIESTFNLAYKQYFLYFGSIEPKKNIGRMIEGYFTSGVQTPLVIVGAQEWKAEQELQLLAAQKIREQFKERSTGGKIVKLEYVSFGLLMSLIRGAKAVLFPSLYEGFGLPVLEAMALGTPVLTSNTSSMPEVAGDAALLVNPYDVPSIAASVRALDSDDVLRAELVESGLRQVAKFSEEAYRRRLTAVYQRASDVYTVRRAENGE